MKKIFFILQIIALFLSFSCSNINFLGDSIREIEMVYVEGGFFNMGNDHGEENERPEHVVKISDFYIGKYPVTQSQWRNVMKRNPSYFRWLGSSRPVERVSWYSVIVFCNKLSIIEGLEPVYIIKDSTDPNDWGSVPENESIEWNDVLFNQLADGYRLPTEAEWEYAARGGSKNENFKFSGSNNIDEVAWYFRNSGHKELIGSWDLREIHHNNSKTQRVGLKKKNGIGIFDMSGNVTEWCWDWYDKDYYSNSPEDNPLGPDKGVHRVARGGDWLSIDSHCTVFFRRSLYPSLNSPVMGFRVVRSSF